MKTQSELFQIVYDFYETRILFGYYNCGDLLPALPRISSYFQLSIPTVRLALTALEKDGYVKVEAPKAAIVTYQASRTDFLRNIFSYLSARKSGLQDMRNLNTLLLGPLLCAGIEHWEESARKARLHEIRNTNFDRMSLTIQIYMAALSSLNNDLILNFYWEINRYSRIPFMGTSRDILDEMLDRVESLPKEEIGTYLTRELQLVYKNANTALREIIREALPDAESSHFSQIPFEWKVYHKRSQVRYTLATRIIQEILTGYYPMGSCLPSLPELASHYEVSLSTIRRALALLSDFGVVKTCQGKGTFICLGQSRVDLSQERIRLGMKTFLESLQFLALTIRPVCLKALNESDDESLNEFLSILNLLQEEQKEYLAMDTCLNFLISCCKSASISHCYGKLMKCLDTGYPFTLFLLTREEILSLYQDFINTTAKWIEFRNFERTAALWESFFEDQEQYFRDFIERMG